MSMTLPAQPVLKHSKPAVSSPDSLPQTGAPSKSVIAALTGIRAVAAWWVVFGHFQEHLTILFPFCKHLSLITQRGYLGVDLFFCLSGFVLAHNYLQKFRVVRPRAYGQFLWLRLARMYPVHLFTLLLLMVGVLAAGLLNLKLNMPGRLTGVDFVRNLFLVHAWGFAPDVSWNGPAWSISAEWFAYLLLPFIAAVVIRMTRAASLWSAIGLCYVALLGLFAYCGDTQEMLANDLALVRIITQFSAGVLLYRLYMLGWARTWRWSVVPYVTLAGVIVYSLLQGTLFVRSSGEGSLPSLLPAPLFGLAILALAMVNGRGWWARMLGARFMVFWGEVSYSLYMTHDIVRMVLKKMLPVERYVSAALPARLSVFATYATLIVVFAIGTYLIIEKPARGWMRDLIGHKARPAPQAAPTQELESPELPSLAGETA